VAALGDASGRLALSLGYLVQAELVLAWGQLLLGVFHHVSLAVDDYSQE
jgi:hypothetical protein